MRSNNFDQRSRIVRKNRRHFRKRFFLLLILVLVVVGVLLTAHGHVSSVANHAKSSPPKKVAIVSKPAPINMCATNTLPQLILVSISQRHTWACQETKEVLSTPVITGNENIASDLTPVGTYHIISKLTDQKIIGCDTDGTGACWNDFVNYDMIFLYNQYGHYDFHDATWRTSNDFGNISPSSSNASHGCVETPLTAMAWLYNWAQVGTTVTIQT